MKSGLEKISPTVRVNCELLGVNPGASPSELKKAYHELALIYHPDRNPGLEAVDEFRKVTSAYELLTDPLRVSELNRKHLTERLHATVIEGLSITFGSFFGYRIFHPNASGLDVDKDAQLLEGRAGKQAEKSVPTSTSQKKRRWTPVEENNSILDHAAYDALEVVYAGRLSREDELAMKGELDTKKLVHLPWVVLNNQGLLKFLDGDIKRSGECYRKLCERVPNNIIFMYRYGLCLILDGFQKPRRTLLGGLKPDRIKIAKGLKLLETCVKIGEARPVGRQKCLAIRKVVADVYEKIGKPRQSKNAWRKILGESPSSIEATYRTKGRAEAEKLLGRRQKLEAAREAVRESQRLLASSGRT